ncbi:LytR C-terminal domain-containing protein [Microgenomates group bacterium]|nr:LytR C-terminal domain-containing protein [Microgenomates group bacterium]
MSQIASLLVVLDKLALVATFNKAKISPFWEIATLRQINGSFINEDHSLNTVNLAKLFSKIEPTTYHLVLPDQLFELDMHSVPHTSDSDIADYLDPAPADSLKQHEVLLKLKDKSQVQTAAIKKQLLDQLFHLQENADLIISQVMALSWLTKPIIGLEPALSLIHIEDKIYLSQHYLGLEKTTELSPSDSAALIDHLKTLKQQEPNLQIIYLMTEARLENLLKRELKGILPVQQLSGTISDDNIAPPVKAYLENAWRAIMTSGSLLISFSAQSFANIPPAAQPAPETPTEPLEKIALEPEPEPEPESEPEPEPEPEPTPEPEPESEPEPEPESEPELESKPESPPETEPKSITEPETLDAPPATPSNLIKSLPSDDHDSDFDQTLADVVAKQKVMLDNKVEETPEKEDDNSATPSIKSETKSPEKKKKSRRPLIIALIIIVATIAIGCILGKILLGVLDSSVNDESLDDPPIENIVPDPTPEDIPDATTSAQVEEPEEDFDPAKYSILVVNATNVSGLAGKIKAKLNAAGYKEVVTGNAAGDYDAAGDYEGLSGDLVLLKTPNLDLIAGLKRDSELNLSHDTNQENYQAEDAIAKYDAVIVLRTGE